MSKQKLRTCIVCGTTFYGTHSGRRGNLVCSEECRRKSITESKKRGSWYSCDFCGELVWRSPSDVKNRVFCNRDCFHKWKASSYKTFICPVCQKGFMLAKSTVKNYKESPCCSLACRNKFQENKIEVPCAICGTIMLLTPSTIPHKKTCSPQCSKRYLMKFIVPNIPNHGTKPELLFEKLEGDLVHRTSGGKFFVTFKSGKCKNPDFIVRGTKGRKVVEIFGRYWHPDPNEEFELPASFKEVGYDCLVIWEDELPNLSYKDKFTKFLGC